MPRLPVRGAKVSVWSCDHCKAAIRKLGANPVERRKARITGKAPFQAVHGRGSERGLVAWRALPNRDRKGVGDLSEASSPLGVAPLRNTRKTERGAGQFLIRFVVRAAPFALLRNLILGRLFS